VSSINVEVSLDNLFDDSDCFADIIRAEVEHEFRLAIRRAIKADNRFKEKAEELVKSMHSELQRAAIELLAERS